MKYISLFSGIEAATVAWKPLGFQAVAFSEIEPFPCELLAHHYPTVPNLGDITKVNWNEYKGSADITVGGSPCQQFSQAGLRQGMGTHTGNLTLEYVRAARAIGSEWLLWENVPGVFSTNRGGDFSSLLSGLTGHNLSPQSLHKAGVVESSGEEGALHVAYRILDAQYFGVPQRRRRIFVVGNSTDWQRAFAVLFEHGSLRWDTEKGRQEELEATSPPEARAGESSWWNGRQVSQTLDAVLYKGQMMPEKNRFPVVFDCRQDPISGQVSGPLSSVSPQSQAVHSEDGRLRRITPLEAERLQGFPDGYTDIRENCPATPRYKAIGNSMAVPVMQWLGNQIKLVQEVVDEEAERDPGHRGIAPDAGHNTELNSHDGEG